ncbi:MAG: RloB family protein [bacterium]
MSRMKNKLSRRASNQKPKEARLLIVCEDEKFSVKYFKDFCEDLKIKNLVTVDDGREGSAPQSVLERACKLVKSQDLEEQDTVYCVIDKDEHSTYAEVVRNFNSIIKTNLLKEGVRSGPQFKLITSVRCFEIWILLHLAYTDKPFKSQDLLSDEIKIAAQAMKKKVSKNSSGTAKTPLMCQALIKNDIKQDNFKLDGRDYSLYDISKELIKEAIKSAKQLRKDKQALHGEDDTSLRLDADPYTEIDLLVEDLQKFSSFNR